MFRVIYLCANTSDPVILDQEGFKDHLYQARYNWRPDLDVDSLIQQVIREGVCPIYRSGNISCCTGVAVHTDNARDWNVDDHMNEIEEANQWYSNHLLLELPDRSIEAVPVPTMATVIHIDEISPFTIVVPLTEHNEQELEYLNLELGSPELGLFRTSTVPNADLPVGPMIMYLQIPRRQNNWTIERWIGGPLSNINWINFLTETQPYVYGREGRFREPEPLAEV